MTIIRAIKTIFVISQKKVNVFFMNRFLSVILPGFCFFTSSGYNANKHESMTQRTIMIVGLGNPGIKYRNTRHNAGFNAVDLLAKKKGFPAFSAPKSLRSEISEGPEKTILVKPLTFMNLSGIATKEAMKKFGIDNSRLIIVHDDIDIPLGNIKVSENRGAGGHNGVTSIIKELGTKDFKRVRIGILPEKKPELVDVFVLGKFLKEEKDTFLLSLESAVSKIESVLSEIR